jgi:hypothetical protein
MSFVFYIEGNEFTTQNFWKVPINQVSSPNDETPAIENLRTGHKFWCEKGWKFHRLTGPAVITGDGYKKFCLNGEYYENVRDWLKEHPNQDETFQKEMLEKYT